MLGVSKMSKRTHFDGKRFFKIFVTLEGVFFVCVMKHAIVSQLLQELCRLFSDSLNAGELNKA